MSFRLVVFDLGGVLVDVQPQAMLQGLSKEARKPLELVEQVIYDPDLIKPLQLGQLSPMRYFEQVRTRLGFAWSFEEFVKAWNSVLRENTETTGVLQRLHGRYKLAVLTNTNVLHDDHIRRMWPAFHQVHYWIASCQVGFVKPEPQIYQFALRQAGLRPHEAVYVDDVEDFVVAARRLGLTAVHFTSGLSLERELRNVGLHV